MSSPLVDLSTMRALLGVDGAGPGEGADGVVVLDVRWRLGGPHGAAQYAAGHVPGAAYVDLATDLAGPAGAAGRHPLPDPRAFQQAMRKVGVDDGRPVVLYDDWGSRAAARAWWLLRHHGHRDVRVLDGGWSAWLAAGAPVEVTDTAERPARAGDFTVRPPQGTSVVTSAELPGLAERGVLLDARAPERYRGEHEPVDPVAGHVPGAVNLPTDAVLDATGRFHDRAALRDLLAGVGVSGDVPVAATCGSGVTACHLVLALEAAGLAAALHPDGWSGWTSDPDRRVATG